MSGLGLLEAGIQIERQWLVRGVSLQIEPGSVTALVGPNGSGKSTTLRMLAGLWRPSEGRAELDGSALAELARRVVARHVSLVPQDGRLDYAFSVRDIVAMGRHPHLGRFEPPGAADTEAVRAAMERTGITHLGDRMVNELSMGERQRVLLARSLATRASVLLLDEPTASLDLDHALETFELVRELAADGVAVALALHDLNAVLRWSDRVAVFVGGRMVASGATADVLGEQEIKDVFGVRAERLTDSDGQPVLVFRRTEGRTAGTGDGISPAGC